MQNEFTDLSSVLAPPAQASFLRVRLRTAKFMLASLRADSGTGPDILPARVLKACAAELALPVVLLGRLILRCGRWPECWCVHWIYPLFKRSAVTDPENYRGLQLTAQLSKVFERLLGDLFVPRLEHVGAFGPFQFAYRSDHSVRNAVL